jgi:hypothetical protein
MWLVLCGKKKKKRKKIKKKKKKKKKKNMVLGFVSYFGVVRSACLAATPTTTIATGMYYQGQQTTEYYL